MSGVAKVELDAAVVTLLKTPEVVADIAKVSELVDKAQAVADKVEAAVEKNKVTLENVAAEAGVKKEDVDKAVAVVEEEVAKAKGLFAKLFACLKPEVK
jgi:hypothetical protein